MAIRLSTLAEIKVLSFSSYLRDQTDITNTTTIAQIAEKISNYNEAISNGDISSLLSSSDTADGNQSGGDGEPEAFFKTIGLARQLRIDENFGTQNYYGIGSPTRPRIVPNNYEVNITAERIQLDTRDLNDFISSPEFWYSDDIQRAVGINDFLFYTYFFVRSKEDSASVRPDIYALMPRSASKAITSGEVMIAHNVQLVGFKYSYEEAFFDLSNLLEDTVTTTLDTTPST